MNRDIQDFIRSYVKSNQKDWAEYMDVLEFHYNNSVHSTTEFTPFELSTSKEVITPLTLVADNVHTQDVDCEEFIHQWQQRMTQAK